MAKMIKACLLLCCLAGCSSEAFQSEDGGGAAGVAGTTGAGEDGGCEDVLRNYCGVCPDGYYMSALHADAAHCNYPYHRDCSQLCGSEIVFCSLSAPCPSGWTETTTIYSEACEGNGLIRADGTNAVVCRQNS